MTAKTFGGKLVQASKSQIYLSFCNERSKASTQLKRQNTAKTFGGKRQNTTKTFGGKRQNTAKTFGGKRQNYYLRHKFQDYDREQNPIQKKNV